MKVSIFCVAFAFATGTTAGLCGEGLPFICGPSGQPIAVNCPAWGNPPPECRGQVGGGLGGSWGWGRGWGGRPESVEDDNDKADGAASQPTAGAEYVERRSLGVTNLPRRWIRAIVGGV